MLESTLPAPPFSVFQSWRRAFWHWPSWGELAFFAFNAAATSPFCDSLWSRLGYALSLFLGLRSLDFFDHLAQTRFPDYYARCRAWLCGVVGTALLVWLYFQFDWHWIATYRPDWRGATGVLTMGLVTALFVGPPLELWNRALKPFDKRADLTIFQRTGAALSYIFACFLWWTWLVWALYQICSQPDLYR